MKNNTLVSVIMTTFNEQLEWVKEAVFSILNQTFTNFEFIIVVDNPDRLDIIDCLNKFMENDDRIKIIINNKNLGLIKSLNKGIALSQGKYIARMDADDISDPNRFVKQIKYVEQNDLDLIGTNAVLFNNKGVIQKTDKLITHNYIERYFSKVSIGIIHPTFFGKQEVFSNCLYNELAMHAEDAEFLAHALSLGYKVGNCPDHLLKVRYRDKSITTTFSHKTYLTAYNSRYCYNKFKKEGVYSYSIKQIENQWNNNKKHTNFSFKTSFLRNAKLHYREKRYFKVMYSMLKAIIVSRSTFKSIYGLVYLRYLKRKEQLYVNTRDKC